VLILRKQPIVPGQATLSSKALAKKKDEEKKFVGFDELRKPLKSKESELAKELIENFHWELLKKRKARNLTRKQVALTVGESEENLKLIEAGILPESNFILVNKLENYYGINLRINKVASAPSSVKDISLFSVEGMNAGDSKKPLREIAGNKEKSSGEKKESGKEVSGSEIEIDLDED
jgi:ribosome-binding protein aMBF1 (putative translation factor)